NRYCMGYLLDPTEHAAPSPHRRPAPADFDILPEFFQPGLILPAAMMRDHLVISASIRARNSSGLPPIGTKPSSTRRARNGSVVTDTAAASLRRVTIAAGVAAGATRPNIRPASTCNPASAMVGTSGRSGER